MPEVVVESALVEAANAKSNAAGALRDGDAEAAKTTLTTARAGLTSLNQALEVLRRHGHIDEAEAGDLASALQDATSDLDRLASQIDSEPAAFTSKRLVTDSSSSRRHAGTSRRRPGPSGQEPCCPRCGGTLQPILWGLPAGPPGPGIILGGCCLPDQPQTHGCPGCGWRGVTA